MSPCKNNIKVVTDLTGWAALNYVKEMPIQIPDPGRRKPQRIDVVIKDVDNSIIYWVDVTKIHEMNITRPTRRPRPPARAQLSDYPRMQYPHFYRNTMPRPPLTTQR